MKLIEYMGSLPPVEVDSSDPQLRRLADDLVLVLAGYVVTVPKGFVFNGASIPYPMRLFWHRFDSKYVYAAAAHDYTYRVQGKVIARSVSYGSEKEIFIPKSICDLIFRYLSLETGTPRYQANAFFLAVFLFGRWSWNKYTPPSLEFHK